VRVRRAGAACGCGVRGRRVRAACACGVRVRLVQLDRLARAAARARAEAEEEEEEALAGGGGGGERRRRQTLGRPASGVAIIRQGPRSGRAEAEAADAGRQRPGGDARLGGDISGRDGEDRACGLARRIPM